MNMKRILFLLLVLSLALCFFACGEEGEETTAAVTTVGPAGTTAPLTTAALTTAPPVTEPPYRLSEEDMTAFLSLLREQYLGITLEVEPKKTVTDEDALAYLNDLRLYYATSSESLLEGTVSLGDTVLLYYRGEADGEPFFGGSNMTGEVPHELVIGSGTFIPGFEDALIGLALGSTSVTLRTDTAAVAGTDGSTVYITCKASITSESGQVQNGEISERVDLLTDPRFSSALKTALTGKHPGDTLEGSFTESLDLAGSGELMSVTLTEVTLTAVVTEENLARIEVTFPESYGAAALAGRDAVFYVHITGIRRPVPCEVNASFIKNTLKRTLADLLPYLPADTPSGATEEEKMVAALPGYLKAWLENEAEAEYRSARLAALWRQIAEAATVIRYPEEGLKQAYDLFYGMAKDSYDECLLLYQGFAEAYPTVESFVPYYYGQAYPEYFENKTAEEGLAALAEHSLKEQMVFYYIVQTENITLTEDEKLTDLAALIQSYADRYDITTEEVLEYYTVDDLLEELLYDKVTDFLMSEAK